MISKMLMARAHLRGGLRAAGETAGGGRDTTDGDRRTLHPHVPDAGAAERADREPDDSRHGLVVERCRT